MAKARRKYVRENFISKTKELLISVKDSSMTSLLWRVCCFFGVLYLNLHVIRVMDFFMLFLKGRLKLDERNISSGLFERHHSERLNECCPFPRKCGPFYPSTLVHVLEAFLINSWFHTDFFDSTMMRITPRSSPRDNWWGEPILLHPLSVMFCVFVIKYFWECLRAHVHGEWILCHCVLHTLPSNDCSLPVLWQAEHILSNSVTWLRIPWCHSSLGFDLSRLCFVSVLRASPISWKAYNALSKDLLLFTRWPNAAPKELRGRRNT